MGWLKGLGDALQVGGQTYTKARKQQTDEEREEERFKLQMALLNENIETAKQSRDIAGQQAEQEKESKAFKLGHDFAGALPESTRISNDMFGKFKGTAAEAFFTPDKTLGSEQIKPSLLMGAAPADIESTTPSLFKPSTQLAQAKEPVPEVLREADTTFTPGQLTGEGYRTLMPEDAKAALQNSKLQADWQKALLMGGVRDRATDANVGIQRDHDMTDIMIAGINAAARAAGGNGGALNAVQTFRAERDLAAEWAKASAPNNELKRQYGQMQIALDEAKKGGRLGAVSQSIITTFNKILDPGSVVRESEYARTPEGAPLVEYLHGLGLRIKEGGPGVTPAELESYVTLAKQFVERADAWKAAVQARIDRTAKLNNLDRESIYGTLPEATASRPATSAPPKNGRPTIVIDPAAPGGWRIE